MALLIVVVAYPEVVFLGGSLSPVGLNDVVNRNAQVSTVQAYPNITTQTPKDGQQDIGARVWQLVPATKFVHRTLSEHQSLAWNPYSAAGTLGPETLADLKLSPFVLLVAVFGASATAFTFVLLAFVVLALYCLQRVFVRTLGLGRVAAVAACVAFLLTGFGASDINSAVGAPFVLFPIVLYTLAEHRRTGGIPRFFAAVAAYAGFILTTFLPVQLLMLVFVHAAAVAIDASLTPRGEAESRFSRSLRLARNQLAVPVSAVGLTAFAWLPALDAVRYAGSDITSYADRVTGSSGSLRMLKILSPWLADTKLSGARPWVGYVGIAPLMLIAGAWSRARRVERRLLIVCVALGGLALAVHAGLPGIRSIGNLPGLQSVRRDYWAALEAAAVTVAVGVAVAVIGRRGANVKAATATGILIALCAVAGWNDAPVLGVVAALAFVLVVIAVARASRQVSQRRFVAIASVLLVAVELFSYQNHARLTRFDVEKHPPAYITFLQQHLGSGRVLDAGRAGLYPEWGAALGIAQIETLNVMQIPSYRAFYGQFIDPVEKTNLFLQIGRRDSVPFVAQPRALDLLSVRYLVVDQDLTRFDAGVRARYPLAFDDPAAGIRVYSNPGAFPNAYLSPALRYQQSGLSSRRVTQTFDRQLLGAAHTAGIPSTAARGPAPGTAKIAGQTNTRVDVKVTATRPAVLVLTDSYYRNWKVTINGHAAHLGRVDAIMRGVVVPRGHSTITFRYHSGARSIGTLISYGTLVLLVLLALASVVLTRRRTATP